MKHLIAVKKRLLAIKKTKSVSAETIAGVRTLHEMAGAIDKIKADRLKQDKD